MPTVKGKHYPYTKKGKAQAKRAMVKEKERKIKKKKKNTTYQLKYM